VKFNRVFINPGHGGNDPGAVGKNLKEAEVNMRIARALYENYTWKNVMMSRWGDIGVLWYKNHTSEAMERICRDANDWKANLFVSIHCNSEDTGVARGFEIWTSPGQNESDKIATSIYNSVQNKFPYMKMRSDISDGDIDKEERFYVLTHTTMPAVLIEAAFISNSEDETMLNEPNFIEGMAAAIYTGIESY
jgi:N-acetylmuramoyl-L-alanine amidase